MDPIRLVSARSSLARKAAIDLAAAVLVSGLVVIVFDWPIADMLAGAACGAVLWGLFAYFIEVHPEVPEAETLVLAPADAETHPTRLARPRLLLLFPCCVALAWLADRWHMGGVFVPGQFMGYAAANTLGAVVVGRWERDHGRAVLVREDGRNEPELYMSRSRHDPSPSQGR